MYNIEAKYVYEMYYQCVIIKFDKFGEMYIITFFIIEYYIKLLVGN